jgi:hypothetical protein
MLTFCCYHHYYFMNGLWIFFWMKIYESILCTIFLTIGWWYYRFISTCHFSFSYLLKISLRDFSPPSPFISYVSIEVYYVSTSELLIVLPDTWTCGQRFWYRTFQIVWQCSDSYLTMWLRLIYCVCSLKNSY